jgi:putative oxidoreductase
MVMADLAVLVLRLGIGIMFMAHGLQKTFGMFGGPGIQGFTKMIAGLGFSPAASWAYVAGYTELIGGLLLIVGLGTRVSAFFLFILITVAAVKVHAAKGFFLAQGGFEYTFVIASACLALLLLGAGKYSINSKF